jgi:hypothetical protein
MADDVAALIGHLGFERADVMGYSLGGGVALQTAIRYPEAVRKLVVVSTPFRRDGWYPEVLAGMGQMGPEAAEPMKATPMYALYSSVAPRPDDWPVLLTKLGALLGQDYDWSGDVAAMGTPTLVVVGDADSVRTSHAVEFFELLGGGKQDAGWDGSGIPDSRSPSCPPRPTTTSSPLPRWRPPSRRSSTRPRRRPSLGRGEVRRDQHRRHGRPGARRDLLRVRGAPPR